MTIYTKGFSTFRHVNRFFPRVNFSKNVQRKPYIDSFSENETFSKLFQSQEKPLGRWCTPISSNKCNPEIKADNANEDNGPGLKDNYPIMAKREKTLKCLSKLSISEKDKLKTENMFENDMMGIINKHSINLEQQQTESMRTGKFDSSEDSLLVSYYSENIKP